MEGRGRDNVKQVWLGEWIRYMFRKCRCEFAKYFLLNSPVNQLLSDPGFICLSLAEANQAILAFNSDNSQEAWFSLPRTVLSVSPSSLSY